MEARSVADIPTGDEWQYEPKWDGFRCLLERDGKTVTMTSKSGQDLKRYFPEVAQAAALLPEQRFILDGELVVPLEGEFSFDALLQRIHPAASRVERLSRETPALYLAFDILKRGKADLAEELLPERRQKLEVFASRSFRKKTLFRLSPASTDLPYQGGNREGMVTAKSFTGNAPGGPSRWSTKRSSEWAPIKPKLVVEVSYDHFTGGRFRHGTTILRWRPDKKPQQCTLDQLQQKPASVEALLS